MPVKVVTFFSELMQRARAHGLAKLAYAANPCPETLARLEDAKAAHDEYLDLCIKSDEMVFFYNERALKEPTP